MSKYDCYEEMYREFYNKHNDEFKKVYFDFYKDEPFIEEK